MSLTEDMQKLVIEKQNSISSENHPLAFGRFKTDETIDASEKSEILKMSEEFNKTNITAIPTSEELKALPSDLKDIELARQRQIVEQLKGNSRKDEFGELSVKGTKAIPVDKTKRFVDEFQQKYIPRPTFDLSKEINNEYEIENIDNSITQNVEKEIPANIKNIKSIENKNPIEEEIENIG